MKELSNEGSQLLEKILTNVYEQGEDYYNEIIAGLFHVAHYFNLGEFKEIVITNLEQYGNIKSANNLKDFKPFISDFTTLAYASRLMNDHYKSLDYFGNQEAVQKCIDLVKESLGTDSVLYDFIITDLEENNILKYFIK